MRFYDAGQEQLSFEDVSLVPDYSTISSREKEVDLSVHFKNGTSIKYPFIGSPMDTVSDSTSVIAMNNCGITGILHRYNTIDQRCKEVEKVRAESVSGNVIAAAVGIAENSEKEIMALVEAGVNMICIDVAHGHHEKVKELLKKVIHLEKRGIMVIVGNVATADGFNFLNNASGIRVGISSGSSCATFLRTGAGFPLFASLVDIRRHGVRGPLVIADGGLKNSGQIVLSLAAGADMAILGSLLSCHEESPGTPVLINGVWCKEYRGMASKEAQVAFRGSYNSNEGESFFLPIKGRLEDTVKDLANGIRSGISYAGCRSISEFQKRAVLAKNTGGGYRQLIPHADKKS